MVDEDRVRGYHPVLQRASRRDDFVGRPGWEKAGNGVINQGVALIATERDIVAGRDAAGKQVVVVSRQ